MRSPEGFTPMASDKRINFTSVKCPTCKLSLLIKPGVKVCPVCRGLLFCPTARKFDRSPPLVAS
jgi:hypothetical protein